MTTVMKQAKLGAKVKQVNLRLPEGIYKALKAEALKRQMSINALILEKLKDE